MAKKIPIAETKMVFNKPTKKALAYECEPSNSIKEKAISNDDSWDKKPKPKEIPLLPMLFWALIVKYITANNINRSVKTCGRILFNLLSIKVY